jgi:hypothetical protein
MEWRIPLAYKGKSSTAYADSTTWEFGSVSNLRRTRWADRSVSDFRGYHLPRVENNLRLDPAQILPAVRTHEEGRTALFGLRNVPIGGSAVE